MDSDTANILTLGNICKVLNENLHGVQLFAGYETGNSRFLSRILCVVMVSFILLILFCLWCKDILFVSMVKEKTFAWFVKLNDQLLESTNVSFSIGASRKR